MSACVAASRRRGGGGATARLGGTKSGGATGYRGSIGADPGADKKAVNEVIC